MVKLEELQWSMKNQSTEKNHKKTCEHFSTSHAEEEQKMEEGRLARSDQS